MGSLIYPRHFAGLSGIAIVVLTISQWHRSGSALTALAVDGALYSSVTAATLRGRYSLRRKLLFVGSAAVLSCLSFSISFYGGRRLGLSAPLDYLMFCTGFGAVVYALLLRRMFMPHLSLGALLLIPLISVLAAAAVYLTGLYSRNIEALAVAWWFAFSAGLWCEDAGLRARLFPGGNPLS